LGNVSNNYFGIKNITKTLDVLDPYEFVYWQYELQNPGYTLTSDIERYYGDFKDYGLYKQMKGTDWQDEVFGRTGTSMYHNLALSGGTKTSKYNISLTRNDEKEIMLGSGYTRTNLTVNTTQKVNKWLSVDLNARLSDYRLKGAGTSNNSRLYHAIQYRPVNGLANFIDTSVDAGDYSIVSFLAYDPVKQTNDDYRRSNQANFNFNGALAASLNKFIQYRLEFGGQYYFNNNDQFFGKNTTNTYSYGEQPLSYITKSDVNSYRLANILTFRKDIRSGHNINIMVGEELNYYKSKSITSSAKYFPDYIDPVSALSMMQLGVADPITTYVNPDVKTSSYFGRINYNYKERYLVSLTSRADGSSKFAPGNRWGFFPSAAFAWRISNENFISFAKDWLSDLKMRVSYGESGNNRISDNAWQKTFSVSTGALYMNGDGENAIPTKLLVPNSILSNPGLKWETTVTNNIGLDFGFLNQRITGSAEVYKNITKDLLVRATIPSSTGYTTQWQNIGQTSNKGLEIVLNGVMVDRKDFRLSASFNIGFNRNRIDNLGDVKRWEQTSGWVFTGGPTGDYLIQEGGSVGQMYGYVTEGMYSVDDFNFTNGAYSLKEGVASDAALIQARRFWPGALKLKDQNGDLIVNAADRVVIGNANPKHTGGFNLMAKFKGFDFSAFFNWVYGNNIYNAMKLYSSTCPSGYTGRSMLNVMNSNNRFIYIDKVSGEIVSDPVKLAEMNKNATIWSAAMNTITLHSWGIEDGSFLRLNTLTLGYSLPKQLLKNVGISQLRIYATGYNLWLWTNYSGFDPEVDTQRSTPLTPGIDWCAYPRSRSFNIGLNVEL
jgi:TonB-linked SusC/RagA family outer membrane protein